ncbi:uncharacterized protein LOC110101421 isoform X1 [Dendrobium catenatum]|uniref:uncharacterized protein LOC110101421 isoform X1 n=1 Tax=Dendrobium catenatum TaxID=906689 RepID=UPI0009F5EF6D|nr:uncharacterized protein LOC110101421 isoform X1 [Dendrobium catenatum]
MVALRVTVSLPSIAFANSLVRCRPAQRPLFAAFASFSSGGATCGQASPLQRQLVLYTKPGCCLCEGLKEKLQAALSLGGSHSLHSVQLQVRDISGNAEWERLYQYEIPVLAKILPDGREEILPRLSPRLGVELIQKKIAAALEQ